MTKAQKPLTIAIDGYSSSGKSTMARRLAATVGYKYVDTGAMYRALTLMAMRQGLVDSDGRVDADGLERILPEAKIDFITAPDGSQHTRLNGEDVESLIRGLDVSANVSAVSAIGTVRKALVGMQQAMGHNGGVVMDGRDIGTVVFPEAELKIFVDASAETRARRRYKELRAKGDSAISYESVLQNVLHRDHIDTTRQESPLRCAPDALRLDNSMMSLDEQDAWLMKKFRERQE